MSTAAQLHASDTKVERGQDALAVSLQVAGWAATTVMATLGVATLFFFVLGSFTLSGTMLHLDNLASRYLAADADRQAQFQMIVCSVLSLSFVLITFFRRASLRAAFELTGADHG
ncbi:MAG: hypothetical protein AAF683_00345 [Pseudomonadota bacterium]